MADKQSRLAEIYKAEKSKGGGLASTLGKRVIEKIDPRQFFNQKGFMASAMPSLFKSYKAQTASAATSKGLGGGSFSTGVLENKLDVLVNETRELKIHSKIAAKNSVVLPSMARDMNVTRQNIVKLVKLQGGTATTKADMFFKRAGDREAGYESKFSKAGGVASTKPTQVGAKPEESGGFFSTLMTTLSGVGGFASKLIGFFSSIFGIILASGIIGQFLADEETKKTVKDFISKVLTKFFNGVSDTFDVIKESFNHPEVQKSIRKAINSIISAIGEFLSIKITKLFDTPFGEVNLTIGGALAAVVAGFVAFKASIATLTAAVLGAAGKMAVGGAAGGAPGVPGKPGGILGKVATGALIAWGATEGYIALKNWNWGKGTNLSDKEKKEFSDKTAAELKLKTGLDPTTEEVQQAVEQKLTNQKVTSQKEDMAVRGTALGVATAATGASAISAVSKQVAPVASKVAAAGLEAATKPNSVWGKFLEFVAKKSPRLFASIGYRLASSGLAATVPGPGWLYAAMQLGMSIYTALELFDLWKQFNNLPSTDDNIETPTLSTSTTPIVEGAGGAAFAMYSKPGMQPKSAPVPYSAAADSQAANTTTPSSIPSIPGSSKERLKTPTIEKFDYKKYKELVGKREGDGKYDTDNTYGFLGKYQFGGLALETFGYLKPGTGADKKSVYNPSNWTGKNGMNSADDFKKASDIQEKLMNAYTDMNLKGLQKSGVITGEDSGSAVASKLYAAHHGGVGGANQFFLKNKDTADFAFANASVGKSASLMATAYETGQIGGAEYSGLGGSGGTAVASAAKPESSVGSMLAGMVGSSGSSMLASLAASAPNAGSLLESLTGGYEDMLRSLTERLAPNITNVTNNTVAGGGGNQQGMPSIPSAFDDEMVKLMDRSIYGSA